MILFTSCFKNALLFFAVKKNYPDFSPVNRKPKTTMGDLQHGHLKTGLGRCSISLILTYKINWTKKSSFFALP